MIKTYIFLATGFEEVEAITPIDYLRRAEFDVVSVSITGSKLVCGAHDIILQADCLFEECDFFDAQLLVLPGGMPGTSNLMSHEGLKKTLLNHYKNKKEFAAICAAPTILGKLGFLNGKKATCFPGCEKDLEGAFCNQNDTETDGTIITGKGAGVANEFSIAIVAYYKGKEYADKLAQRLCFQ